MADPTGGDMNGSGRTNYATSPSAVQAEFERRARAIHQDFSAMAAPDTTRATESDHLKIGQKPADTVAATSADLKAQAGSTVTALKNQATEAAIEAKHTVLSLAEEARHRFLDLVDQQKAAGADRLTGVARAAEAAAGDLDRTSPEMARLVRTAAAGVDRLADDIKSRDLDDILASLTAFGRRQPVAFFGGAVLAGFMLARFFKTDAPKPPTQAPFSPRGDI